MFFAESGHNLVKSAVLTAIGMNKFLYGEFRVFLGKWSLVALGVTMEILMVIQNVVG